MRVSSFDPSSYRNLGWAVIDYEPALGKMLSYEAGTYVTPREFERHECLPYVFDFVQQFLAEKKPDLMVIEQTSSFQSKGKNFVAGQVAQCIGIMIALCLKKSIAIQFVFPSHSKKVVVGKGKATKSEMQKSAEHVLNALGVEGKIKFDSEHAADALGNIFCHLSDTGVFVLPAPLFTKPKKAKKKDKDNG